MFDRFYSLLQWQNRPSCFTKGECTSQVAVSLSKPWSSFEMEWEIHDFYCLCLYLYALKRIHVLYKNEERKAKRCEYEGGYFQCAISFLSLVFLPCSWWQIHSPDSVHFQGSPFKWASSCSIKKKKTCTLKNFTLFHDALCFFMLFLTLFYMAWYAALFIVTAAFINKQTYRFYVRILWAVNIFKLYK